MTTKKSNLLKDNWNEIDYQTENRTIGNWPKFCRELDCEHLIWKEDNTLFCKKKRKVVEKGEICKVKK